MPTITFHLHDGATLSLPATDNPAEFGDFMRRYVEGEDLPFKLDKAPAPYRELWMSDVARIEVAR